MKRIDLGTAAIAVLVSACSGDSPLAPERLDAPMAARAVAAGPVDISGAWRLSQTHHLTFPPFAALLIFGVEPEGQRTVATCRIEGVMELSQDGRSFHSSEMTATTAACETLGGQSFDLHPEERITGEIVGRVALRMTSQGAVSCRLEGAAGEGTDGVASTLHARGHCVIPGHPKSGVPGFDPPPAGTEVITSWTAERR